MRCLSNNTNSRRRIALICPRVIERIPRMPSISFKNMAAVRLLLACTLLGELCGGRGKILQYGEKDDGCIKKYDL